MEEMVARDGIEPPTPAFSGPRSTTELPGLSRDVKLHESARIPALPGYSGFGNGESASTRVKSSRPQGRGPHGQVLVRGVEEATILNTALTGPSISETALRWVNPLAVRSKQPDLVYQRQLCVARPGASGAPSQNGDHDHAGDDGNRSRDTASGDLRVCSKLVGKYAAPW